jgi:GNAT superfamily N-acetyltransferase
MVGTETTILHKATAWLAHIIVDPDFRNRGIRTKIVNVLMDRLKNRGCLTIFIVATKLGDLGLKFLDTQSPFQYIRNRPKKSSYHL